MSEDTPNAVTLAAIAEYEEMRKNPGSYKRYDSVDELFEEALRNERDSERPAGGQG